MRAEREIALIFPRLRYPSGDPPLGLLYIASSLEKRLGIEPFVLDLSFSRNPEQEVYRIFSEYHFKWAGISAMITMSKTARKVANIIKSIAPDTKIIIGGPHPTSMPELAIAEKNFDILAIGEAEQTIVELIEKGSPENVAGVWFRKDGEVIKNPAREPIQNLDEIPFPDFDLIDNYKYIYNFFQLDSVKPNICGSSIIATRGCPFQCSFCQPTLEKLFGKKLRKRSPENIAQELKILKDKYKIQGFIFVDDTLIVDKKWAYSLSRVFQRENLNLLWGANVRAELVDEDLLGELKEVGLRKIYIGIEAYSDRIRNEVLNKSILREEIERAVKSAKKLGLKTQGYFMIGSPGETKEEVKQSLSYSRMLGLDDLTINLTTPLPNSYLYHNYFQFISIPPEDFDYYRRYPFKEQNFTENWLRATQIIGYFRFYIRPRWFIRMLISLIHPRAWSRTFLKLKRVFSK